MLSDIAALQRQIAERDSVIAFLIHKLGGRIEIPEKDILEFFDPSKRYTLRSISG